MGGLTFAEGAVLTVKGLIATRSEKGSNGQVALLIHVPANTRSSAYIPKLVKRNFILTESGKRLWPADSTVEDSGMVVVFEERSAIKCLAGSGDYRFGEMPSNF